MIDVTQTPDLITIGFKLLQMVGVGAAIKLVLWIVEFRNDVKEIKGNHLAHIQASQETLVKLAQAQLDESRELRADIRVLSSKVGMEG